MTKLFNSIFFAVVRAPEDEGAGSGNETPADPGSVLFPNDKPAEPAADGDKLGDEKPGEAKPDDDKPAGDKPAEWKEYVNDPKKTDAENATAKAEHDKTKPDDKKDGDKNKDPADQVPADGKYDLKLPDGVKVDDELLSALGPQFKDLGLTNGQAQKLAEAYTKTLQDRAAKQGQDWANTVNQWADDAKADKEIGGDKWDATVTASQRAVNKLGTPELREYLNASGGGNHPELIRFMSKVGAMIREDNPASGGAGGSSKPADPAHVLFPSDAPKG